MKYKLCKICSNKFLSISSNHLYCDNCRYAKCLKCNKVFITKPLASNKKLFCSSKCYYESLIGRKLSKETISKIVKKNTGRKTGKIINCEYCNDDVYKYPKNLKKHKHHFCSKKCAYLFSNGKHHSLKPEFKIGQNSREKAYNWKGGITSLYKRLSTCRKNLLWKKQVLKRDKYTCQKCKKLGKGDLNIHHIKYFSLIFSENNIKSYSQGLKCKELWNIDNGITFCEKCHTNFHKKNGFRIYQ